MKKCFALLMTLVLLMTTAAFAEEAYMNWEIPAEAVGHGDTWTTSLNDKNIALKTFVYDGWELVDRSLYQPNVRSMWATEDGRTLELGYASCEEINVYNIEDAAAMAEKAGLICDFQTMNGMAACLISSADMLSVRGMIAVIPEGVLIVRVTNLKDESQIEEADNMVYSVTPVAIEKPDMGVKKSELNPDEGCLMPIAINGETVTMFLYNEYEIKDKDDTWQSNMVGRRATADGHWVDLYLYTMNELNVSSLDDVYTVIKNAGYEANMNRINGQDTICFYRAEDMSEQGIALLMANGYVLAIKAGPIHDEDQEAKVLRMLWSLAPAE